MKMNKGFEFWTPDEARLGKGQQRSQLMKKLHCCGITVSLEDAPPIGTGGGSVTSTLHEEQNPEVEGGSEEDTNHDRYEAAVDALESVVLAHACAGIDIQAPAYVEGVETAIAAIAHEFA